MSKTKEAEQLVDLILDDSYVQVKEADRKTDRILDQVTGPPPMKDEEDLESIEEHEDNVVDEVPDENIAATKKDIEKEVTEQDEVAGDEEEKEKEEEIEEKCKEGLKEETEYQKFFKKKLADMGVKSPAELSDKKKKEFFNVIDKEWKAEKETD